MFWSIFEESVGRLEKTQVYVEKSGGAWTSKPVSGNRREVYRSVYADHRDNRVTLNRKQVLLLMH